MERKTQFCAITRPIISGSCHSIILENTHLNFLHMVKEKKWLAMLLERGDDAIGALQFFLCSCHYSRHNAAWIY